MKQKEPKYKCYMCNKMITRNKRQWLSDFIKHYRVRRCVSCNLKLKKCGVEK